MSTVDKETADKVIAGAFPEDRVCCIVKYSNQFNGDDAYKLIYEHQRFHRNIITASICGSNKSIYWEC